MADETTASQETIQQIDLNPGLLFERVDAWIDGAVRLLPNVTMAVAVAVVFYLLALLARRVVENRFARRKRENLGEMLGGFAKWAIVLFGALLAATIVMPTLKPGDIVAGLGVSSVAIGFAFKDILQNWLAGLLILLRQPFEIHDQIEVKGHEGTVEHIATRATIIRTHDGQRILVPNSDIYTNAVLVKTAHDKRRSQYDVTVADCDDIDRVCERIRAAIASVPEVESDPSPEAFAWAFSASEVTVRARWWTGSRRTDAVHTRAAVIQAIRRTVAELEQRHDAAA